MKMKSLFTLLVALFAVNVIQAQTEPDGFSKINRKEYSEAKKTFAALLKVNPENVVAIYGMGECQYYTNKLDSAKIWYQKGIETSSSFAGNYAGMGKVLALSNPVEAENYFKDAVKKSKKDANAIISIAKMYYEQTPRNYKEAKRYLNIAIGVDSKNASAYFLNGLISLDENNTSDASLQFERAIYFDPNLLEAYLYQSRLMASARNLQQAIEYSNKIISINPKYWPAYKNLGELYYDNQKYTDAITNFEVYFKNVKDDKDMTHYAYSLFFNKQYQQAREIIDRLIQQNPNDYILLRLLGYISVETKDLVNGKNFMDTFFTLVPEGKILSDDYLYYGKMLSVSGNDSLAIENYKLALKKDSTQFQVFDELARSCAKLKKYEQSLKYSCQYIKKKPNVVTADYFLLGKAFYSTANNLDVKTDSLKQMKYYHEADSIFTLVETYSPNSYLGPFWRARVNSAIDRETTLGLAKPLYEKALQTLAKDTTKYKKEVSEIYAYMGFYYYQKEDKTNSIDYWKKLLVLDPENLKAQEALKSLEKK